MVDDQHRVHLRQFRRVAKSQRRRIERRDGPDQTKPARVVIAHHFGRQRMAAIVDDVDFIGFDDEVADSEDQSILVDHNARAFALRA